MITIILIYLDNCIAMETNCLPFSVILWVQVCEWCFDPPVDSKDPVTPVMISLIPKVANRSKIVSVSSMKAFRRLELEIDILLHSALGRYKCSSSGTFSITPGGGSLRSVWTGVCVARRSGLDVLEEKYLSLLGIETQLLRCPARKLDRLGWYRK
jgi:hypothetical protein